MTITQDFTRRARDLGVDVRTRRQWHTRRPQVYTWRRVNRRHFLLPKRPADTLVQHITVTHNTKDFAADMQMLERIGMDRFGSGVSYNLVWDMWSGTIGIGNALDAKGTHTINDKGVHGYTKDQNGVAIGIAALGMPGDRPSSKAIGALTNTIVALVEVNALTRGHDYVPHSLFAFKDCPCDETRELMPQIHKQARELASMRERKR